MAATDMRLAGLEVGALVTVSGLWSESDDPKWKGVSPTGTVVRLTDSFGNDQLDGPAARVLLSPPQDNIHAHDGDPHPAAGKEIGMWARDCMRHYHDAQAARQRRFSQIIEHYPGDAGMPEESDTIERFVLVQINDTTSTEYAYVWGDTFDEAVQDAGSKVLDGWIPEAVFDLDTGARIEVHVSSPVVTRSEDQGAMVNVLSETDLDELQAEQRQIEEQTSIGTRDARRLEYIEDTLAKAGRQS